MRYILILIFFCPLFSCDDFFNLGIDEDEYKCQDKCYIFEGKITHAITGAPASGKAILRHSPPGMFNNPNSWEKSLKADGTYRFRLNANRSLYTGDSLKAGDFDLSFKSSKYTNIDYFNIGFGAGLNEPDSLPQVNEPYILDFQVHKLASAELQVKFADPSTVTRFQTLIQKPIGQESILPSVYDVKATNVQILDIYDAAANGIKINYWINGEMHSVQDTVFGDASRQKLKIINIP